MKEENHRNILPNIAGGSRKWILYKCFQTLNFMLPNTNLYEKLARKFDKALINAIKLEGSKADKFMKGPKGRKFNQIFGVPQISLQLSPIHV